MKRFLLVWTTGCLIGMMVAIAITTFLWPGIGFAGGMILGATCSLVGALSMCAIFREDA